MQKCKQCGNEFEGKFCNLCGTKVESNICSNCRNEYTGNFCNLCGTPYNGNTLKTEVDDVEIPTHNTEERSPIQGYLRKVWTTNTQVILSSSFILGIKGETVIDVNDINRILFFPSTMNGQGAITFCTDEANNNMIDSVIEAKKDPNSILFGFLYTNRFKNLARDIATDINVEFEDMGDTSSMNRIETRRNLDSQRTAYCPKCLSTSLSSNKKGFGIGKAIVGAALTGGIGLVAGNIGAKKVRITCLNCGHQFWAGKR